MRRFAVHALLLAALPLAAAQAALQTRSMDTLREEVAAREAALTGELTRSEKRLKSAYARALAQFQKESASRTQDVKRMRKILSALSRPVADDPALEALATTCVDDFLAEIDASLAFVHRAQEALRTETRTRTRAERRLQQADDALGDAQNALTLRKKLRACTKSETRATVARRWMNRALEDEPELTPHENAFLLRHENGYAGTADCLECHADEGGEMLASAHFRWQGVSSQIEGHETHVHGKADLINNFCIAVPSNEGRCTQCHAGFGWKDGTFDFANATSVDCLVCHDTTGTYAKDLTTAGRPVAGVDLTEVALRLGAPSRANCGACHFFAGGGDNVKHGDLASTMATPTRDGDVHMGTDGLDYTCQRCHATTNHAIPGNALHSQGEGRVECTDCHLGVIHQNGTLEQHRVRVACQTCHIPTFSRSMPTKMEWWWGDAGQDVSPIPTDAYGKALYDKKKGSFRFEKSVRPKLRWFNGTWRRFVIGEDDRYTSLPAVLAEPVGSKSDPNSKIYPFKLMVGNQPADTVEQRILVPHLFGAGPGPNPYWSKFDWALALSEGAAYAGQPYSGTYGFVETEMYMSLNHEVAPKSAARACTDCHNGGIDFTELGYSADPLLGGE